jgi:hypothetical protein
VVEHACWGWSSGDLGGEEEEREDRDNIGVSDM